MPLSRFRFATSVLSPPPERRRFDAKSRCRKEAGVILRETSQQGDGLMKRRDFLKVSATGAAAAAVASPAIAQSSP